MSGRHSKPWALLGALLVADFLAACGSSAAGPSPSGGGRVLLVGTFKGHRGQYTTIAAAVRAARSGDWILVGPGDYHETADEPNPPSTAGSGGFGSVLITTSDLHLRGMDRNTVIVDGTKPGSGRPCSAQADEQNFGPLNAAGKGLGRNGIVVWKANDVTIENLTTCNFLGGAGDAGNGIWWNGGDGSGKIGLHGYSGGYLTSTTTYFGSEATGAQYGIFSSNSAGPGNWNELYASNFNDSGMYVGACHQACDMTITNSWMEYDALGYSGTNSGGSIVIEHNQFDNNEDGFDTNTQINGDPPAPQNGACPHGGISPITHTHSCWVFMDNYSHNNNNPNVPSAGTASAGPVGTGMTLSGGRNDTVMDNRFSDNGAWGILFVPYPDSNKPSLDQSCRGTGGVENTAFGCVYDPINDALLHNTFSNNGYFGNPGNSDFGQIVINAGQPQNCFAGNDAPNGSAPPNLEQLQPTCGGITKTANTGGPLLAQVLCDTGFAGCPPGATYPKATGVVLHPLPKSLPSMPNPCQGVPSNAWCSAGKPV
ncbi:MAG: hypothetical protein ACLP9C_07840 [Acidimicrobiales bacterium]